MMAVDSKQGDTAATPKPGPAATLAGAPAVSAVTGRRKRPSSLMAQAVALPSVESSLDEFIAKANETLVDPAAFNADQRLREEDEKRKEHDALRWKAAEQQMRESHAREDALRRQLTGLQGQLAEAEARAAVAGSGGPQDGVIADLRLRLTMADEKVRSSEEKLRASEERLRTSEAKIGQLERDVTSARQEATAAKSTAVSARDSASSMDDEEADQRVRLAEAKAAKAIAAAKAASAGLTVSQADIAAIESGLVVTSLDPPARTSPVGYVAAAIIGGALCFLVAFLVFGRQGAAPARPQPAQEVAPAKPPAAPPVVTPIDEAAANPPPAATADSHAAPSAEPSAPSEKPDGLSNDTFAKDEPVAPVAKPAGEPAATPAAAQAPAQKATATSDRDTSSTKASTSKASTTKAPTGKATSAKKSAGALADPFGDAPAPAPKKKDADKKSGARSTGLVDPF